jgi:hypothetical protein
MALSEQKRAWLAELGVNMAQTTTPDARTDLSADLTDGEGEGSRENGKPAAPLKLTGPDDGLGPVAGGAPVGGNTAAPGDLPDGTVLADVGGPPGGPGKVKDKEKPKEKIFTKGPLSEAEHKQWLAAHPKAKHERVGPWLPADMYGKFTKQYFLSKGYFYSGKMNQGSYGEYDEVWLNNSGDGTEYRVARDPTRQKQAPAKPKDATYDPDEDADDDVIEAQKRLKENGEEMRKVQAKLKELLDHRGKAEFENLRKVYLDMEAKWQENLRKDIEYIDQFLNPPPPAPPPSADSKPELDDVRAKFEEYDRAFPYGDEWKGRADIEPRRGDPIRVKPPVTVKGDGPTTF